MDKEPQNKTNKLSAINPKVQYPFITLTSSSRSAQTLVNPNTIVKVRELQLMDKYTILLFGPNSSYVPVRESISEINALISAVNNRYFEQNPQTHDHHTLTLTVDTKKATNSGSITVDMATVSNVVHSSPYNKNKGIRAIICLNTWDKVSQKQVLLKVKESIQEIAELMNVINKPHQNK